MRPSHLSIYPAALMLLLGSCVDHPEEPLSPVQSSRSALETEPLGVDMVAPPAEGCAEVQRWLTDHWDALPENLAELRRVPKDFRRAAYSAVPIGTKLHIWGQHFDDARNVGFLQTLEEIAVLREIEEQLPVLLKAGSASADNTRFSQRIVRVFGAERGGQLFASLEPVDMEATSEQGLLELEDDTSTCNCAYGSTFTCNDITGPNRECVNDRCGELSSGCGLLWLQRCSGRCVIADGGEEPPM